MDLIKEPTKENEAAWKNEVNKYIFTSLGFEFDKSVSDRLNFGKSLYISEILSGNDDFKENFKEILQLLKDNPTKDIKDIFDELPQNKATKEMFEKIGINYNKYCSVDENLNVDITVTTSADKAKKSAIEALEKEFKSADKRQVLHKNSFLKYQESPKSIFQELNRVITTLTLQ